MRLAVITRTRVQQAGVPAMVYHLGRLDSGRRVRFLRDLSSVLRPLLRTKDFVTAARPLSNLPTEA